MVQHLEVGSPVTEYTHSDLVSELAAETTHLSSVTPAEVGGLVERLSNEVCANYEKDGDGYYDTPLTYLLREAATALEAQAAELAKKNRLLEIALCETAPARDEANKRANAAEAALAEARKALEEIVGEIPGVWETKFHRAQDIARRALKGGE